MWPLLLVAGFVVLGLVRGRLGSHRSQLAILMIVAVLGYQALRCHAL